MERLPLDVLRLVLLRCPLESWLAWRLSCRALLRVADHPTTLQQLWALHRPPELRGWPPWSGRALLLELVRPVRVHELVPVLAPLGYRSSVELARPKPGETRVPRVRRNTYCSAPKSHARRWLFWRLGQLWRCGAVVTGAAAVQC